MAESRSTRDLPDEFRNIFEEMDAAAAEDRIYVVHVSLEYKNRTIITPH